MNRSSEIPPTGESQRTPDELERDIDGTREELTRTLDALESKLSPRKRLHAAADSLRETGERYGRRGLNAVTPSITTMIRMDHTHVLALFRRFKPTTPQWRKRALVENACLALEVHAQLEEEIFYPALAELIGSNPILEKSVPEHSSMRELIATLRSLPPGDAVYDDMFRMLMREVLHHVADEETILLPLAEELMGDELGELGVQMTKRRAQLLGPHLKELAMTSARSFPVLTGGAIATLLWLAWRVVRPPARL
jgi:hemerythrin superfamily protein